MAQRLRPGDPAPPLRLERAGGGRFEPAAFAERRWLLSFHRYAT
ncbi:MAG: hypothetical protein ACE5H3_00960 [Planctomycetota bacterium]